MPAVHVLSHGLHYGYAIFDGIRCRRTDRGSAIFRLEDHLGRFLNSAKIYRMQRGYSLAELKEACIGLVRQNAIEEAYVRPLAFSSYREMGLDPTRSSIDVAVALWEWGAYLGQEGLEQGVRVTISSWIRVDS